MKASELVRLLGEWSDDADIFIQTEDGVLHDFKAVEREDIFDGFDTVYESGLNLVMTE